MRRSNRRRLQYRRRRRRGNTYWRNFGNINSSAKKTYPEEGSQPLDVLDVFSFSKQTVIPDTHKSTLNQSCVVESPAKRLRTDITDHSCPVDSKTLEHIKAGNSWINLNTELFLTKVPYMISVLDMWKWFRQKWTQSLKSFKDRVFLPHHGYQQELQLTKDRVLQLEHQLKQIMDSSLLVPNQQPPSLFTCNCPCKSANPVFFPQCSGLLQINTTHGTSDCAFIPPPPPPPLATVPLLPPPPPPPPPPAPPTTNQVQFKVKQKKPSTKKNAKNCKNSSTITLTDIKNVRLNKVNQNDLKQSAEMGKKSSAITLADIKNVTLKKVDKIKPIKEKGFSGPLVSLSALKRIKLRQTRSSKDENTEDVQSKLSEEAVSLRKTLKKVSMACSPGRTPIKRKRPQDHGIGMTPIMTRALKNKFKNIRTPSPALQELSSETSHDS